MDIVEDEIVEDSLVITEDEEGEIENEDIEEDELEESEDEVEILTEDDLKETEDEPEEKKKLEKKMPRSQKRIMELNKKYRTSQDKISELESKINELSNSERNRSQKETESYNESKLNDITQKQRQAYEEGDYDSIQKYNLELLQMNQVPKSNNDDLADPEKMRDYFISKNPWYNNERQDPGMTKTYYAQGLSSKYLNDKKYANWSKADILDEVSKATELRFKTNRLKGKSPTAGVTNNIPASKKNISITKEDYDIAKKLYPEHRLNLSALRKKIIESYT